jgi:hypothetical protein
MSVNEQEHPVSQPATERHATGQANMRPLGTIMIGLLLLDVIGIGVTEFAIAFSQWYWLGMVVVTALACAFIVRFHNHRDDLNTAGMMRNEILFWLAVLVAVNLVFFLYQAGRLDSENSGLVILLLLALSTFLAGLRLGWQLCLLGGVLAAALIVAAYLEEFLWLALLVGLVAVVVLYFLPRIRGGA